MNNLKKQGIEISVYHNGEKLNPEGDGYLGKFFNGKFNLEVAYEKRNSPSPLCFIVDGQKKIIRLHNHSDNVLFANFSINIPVEKKGKKYYTKYPANNMRIIVFGENGTAEHWEVSIIGQINSFFLITQKTYLLKFFKKKDGTVCCPGFEKRWKDLVELIKPELTTENGPRKGLLPLSQYILPKNGHNVSIPPKQGIVQWWNCAQGLGAILIETEAGEKKSARVYWENVSKNGNRLILLFPGQKVEFRELVKPLSERTNFDLEAIQVASIK